MRNKSLLLLLHLVFISFTNASSNKENFKLLKEDFSAEQSVDYQSVYKHINYTFTNQDYLTQALYPLLPQRLRHSRKEFEHLEFLGDAVLGVVIRERILTLFSDDERGIHNDIYNALTQNKTLSSVFITKLKGIQHYLPYPGDLPCKYCNVVEALIGAIYKDNDSKNLGSTQKFIMRILDDHLLKQKWQEVNTVKSTKTQTLVLPKIKSIIESFTHSLMLHNKNPKSLLNEILTQVWQDSPSYRVSLGKDEFNTPLFMVTVEGAQIGHTITGVGSTIIKAEEDAARKAINFLAQETLLPSVEDQISSYAKIVLEYTQYKQLRITYTSQFSSSPFKIELHIGGKSIAEGSGASKVEAKENAAKDACFHLLKTENIDPRKNFRTLLQEWSQKEKGRELKYLETASAKNIFLYKLCILENIYLEETAESKEEARENAYRQAFEYFLAQALHPKIQNKALNTAAAETELKRITTVLNGNVLKKDKNEHERKKRIIKPK